MSWMSRRSLIVTLAASAVLPWFLAPSLRAGQVSLSHAPPPDDPALPTGGNPKGDVTIVTFVDYNCPFCKKAEPALRKLLATDHGIRMVYRDWPILTRASGYGAQLALAAAYQGKYQLVHDTLMALPGMAVTEAQMATAVRASGVDIDRLNRDLRDHFTDITAVLKSTQAQATALGLQGTPAFLIGPYKVPGALNYDGFRQVVAEARAARP